MTLHRATHALAYAERGFNVFPLHYIAADGACSCKDADCRSPAKHPMTVHGAKDATTDEATIRAWWQQWPDANIGMTLPGLAVIDTDPRNGGDATLDALQDEHGPLPDTALALTGGGGTHHVYRAPDDIRLPGTLGKGVDLKRGAHSYIVVEPSLHASGIAYAWEASSSLLDGFAPAPLPEWIAKPVTLATVPVLATTGTIPPQQAIELRSALAYIPADEREIWLAVGMALHSTGAKIAFALWTEWSQLSSKYNAADQARVWASFKSDGRHVESIFAMAAERGWVNPGSRQAQRFDEAVEAAIAQANAPSRVEIVEATPISSVDPLPVQALNELASWIRTRYALTHPAVTTQTVLALASMGASRVYAGEDGSPCHLCLGVVAESTILTAYARDAVARVLDGVGLRRMMRGTRVNTPSNVYATLWRSPAAIHVVSDFGHLAAFAKRQPSGVLDQAFSVMADAYSASALYVDSAAEAGLKNSASDDQLVVRNPALTTLLLSTREQMGGLLQRGEIARGLLAYQLPVLVGAEGAVERAPTAGDLPAALHDLFLAVRRMNAGRGDRSMQEIFGSQPGAKPNLVRVRYAVPFDEYASAIHGVSDELNHRPLVLAALGTARRMCNALSPWDDPHAPVASRSIMDWSTAYVIRHLTTWLEQYSTLGNDEGRADVGQKVVAAIVERKSSGIPRGDLHMFCRAFRSIRDREKRTKLVDGLIEDGDIVEFSPEGSRKKILVAAKFARRVELRAVS